VHDTRVFDQLLTGQERAVYADKGYANKERRARLKASRVRDGILHKAYRNRPLTKQQRARNKLLSAIRNSVERPFGFIKQVLNYQLSQRLMRLWRSCRYFDLARNRFQFIVCAVLYNLRRMLSLTATIRA
jgi:IS5 family transposase